jgi:hypothetical protein
VRLLAGNREFLQVLANAMSAQLTAAEAVLRFRVRAWIEPLERATATTAQNHHQTSKNDKTHSLLREVVSDTLAFRAPRGGA